MMGEAPAAGPEGVWQLLPKLHRNKIQRATYNKGNTKGRAGGRSRRSLHNERTAAREDERRTAMRIQRDETACLYRRGADCS